MYLLSNIILTILATSDIYSLLSYGRIKTHIEKNYKMKPHLTVLSGDFINPIKYTNIDGGITISNILDLVPIDIVSFGNHEFDISIDILNNSLKANYGSTFISTNIYNISNNIEEFYLYDDFLNNLTIGFVGLCTQNFYQKNKLNFATDEQINKTINNLININNPDLIIGLTHGELEEDYLFVDKFPQIDIILGGHIHSQEYTEYSNILNKIIPIIRTGENANFIYEISINRDKSFFIDLVDLSENQIHPEIYDFYEKKEKMFEKYNQDVLFYFNSTYSNINPRTNLESLPQLICSIITNYFSSNLTILNSGTFKLKGKSFNKNFTVGNFKELMPYDDHIVVININPFDLINGIEYSNTKHYGNGGYLQIDNIDFVNYLNYTLNNCFDSRFNIDCNNFDNIILSTSTLILDGIDTNPFFSKYKVLNIYDGIPIQNIIMSYKNFTF